MNKNLLLPSFIFAPIIIMMSFFIFGNFNDLEHNNEAIQNNQKTTITTQLNNTFDDFSQANNSFVQNDQLFSDRSVLTTNGIRHTIDLDTIMNGGPQKDGIPSIDQPKFITISEAEEFLPDDEPGISFQYGDDVRFYPFKILVWHEIINDTVADGDKKILVSYCPLCRSGVVFEPYVDGEYVEFGTSGKVWNSNLIMYDRKTNSYWSQILGESIVGQQAGKKLNILPFDQLRFGEWKKRYENGRVLSKETGAIRLYGMDPYGDYYTSASILYPVDKRDTRLLDKKFILGVTINGESKAYVPEDIKNNADSSGVVVDELGGVDLELHYIKDLDVIRIFKVDDDRLLERINPVPGFWFAWVAVHPETEVYK